MLFFIQIEVSPQKSQEELRSFFTTDLKVSKLFSTERASKIFKYPVTPEDPVHRLAGQDCWVGLEDVSKRRRSKHRFNHWLPGGPR